MSLRVLFKNYPPLAVSYDGISLLKNAYTSAMVYIDKRHIATAFTQGTLKKFSVSGSFSLFVLRSRFP